uniref:3-phenylpropionate/trans-cinnamate dioxygenase ferredoxin subunit n=1 Tax=Candidatus Kentrum sp. DK TaxID=2126562 RepID=A0A450SHH1_9GAMM|nr:MAG: 3-phenylpropionate/trans-cinnamate dioxygenase ferredoxin subunit [Candidatus Kentron sp. DK]VFJ52615.1 MAG: 3-phenylpropionate/trans-cinnamate dioxygenase ferredoxin subunit [Candidatus Kentron sp. DK]
MKWITIAPVDDFAPNSSRTVTVEGTRIAVFNLNGEFHAMEGICTHEYKTLEGGTIEDGEVVCPWHGARFDIRTGEATCAPAYDPVDTFETRVEEGLVQVGWPDA